MGSKTKRGQRKYIKELKQNFNKNRRPMSTLYLVMTTLVLVALVGQILRKDFENCFTCVLTLILFTLPIFLERTMKITLPNTLEVIIILFIFCAEILGEIHGFYLRFFWWDTMLHALNGFLMAGIGVSMIDIFNKSERFKFELSPFFVALVAFCFSMTIGVLWEFFEFFMDIFAHTDMQKDTLLQSISTVSLHPRGQNTPLLIQGVDTMILSGNYMTVDGVNVLEKAFSLGGYLDIGLVDTMMDLLVNFVGAIIFSIIGYFYCKSQGKRPFANRFIPKLNYESIPETKN